MSRADKTDLLAGAVIVAICGWFAIGALDYRMGTVVRMGPGFVPLGVGLMGIVLGLLIMLGALGRRGALPSFEWRAAAPVLTAIAVFALGLPWAGLIPATVASVLVSSIASPMSTLRATLAVAAAAASVVWVGFVILLGMPIPVLRNPF
jgi:Tripartite tricarboxylate transporter TctB family